MTSEASTINQHNL